MQRTVLYLLFLTALFLYGNASAFSADELFDTKAATKHTEKGIQHLKGKEFDAAIKEFEESVAINPDAEAYYFLGYTYYLKGKTGDGESRKRSKESFDKAYELNPNFSPSRLMEPAATMPKQDTVPAPPAATVPGTQPETETAQPGVFQGTAQPEQQKGPQTPPPPETPVPPKEQPPQEQQPPQQPEQRKSY